MAPVFVTTDPQAPMLRLDAKALLQRHQQALNDHDTDALVSLYTDDAVLMSPMFETVHGKDAIRASFERLFQVFPDYAVEMSDALFIHEGSRAAEFSTARGTHSVELFGLPPTGHRVAYQAARLFTFRDGLIALEHRVYDFRSVLEGIQKSLTDRDLAVASAVQHALHGQTHQRGSFFEAVGTSSPCRAIGGDFLELRGGANGQFDMVVGDVSGKGPAAALVAAMLQGMLAIASTEHDGPEAALARINQVFSGRAMEPRFATVVWGRLAADGAFTYASAGHLPLVLLTRAGARLLTSGGPILGVFPAADFPGETIQLSPGDTVVAFSDGVSEAETPQGEPFGVEGVCAVLETRHGCAPSAIVTAVVDAVQKTVSGASLTDDMTVAAVRFAG